MSRSGRINKSTAVGALAACAVIGATSPVWADSGSSGSSDTGHAASAQDATVISALRGEVDQLKAHLHSEDIALHAAQDAASHEANELVAAKAEIARLKASAADARTTVKTVPVATPANLEHNFRRHDCTHHGDFRDPGKRDDHAFNGGSRGRG